MHKPGGADVSSGRRYRCDMNTAFARILAVEGKTGTRDLFAYGLENFGLEVKTVRDGRSAPATVADWQPEAILLDTGLMGMDCFSLIGSLRRLTDMPILVLSDRSEVSDTVAALTRGADDYITKPFDVEELAARIRARLRRPRMETHTLVTFADVVIDVTYRKATRAGKPLELSTREFDLLVTLARNPERVFTRSQLLDLVWGIDRDVTPATVETYISYLRAKVDVVGVDPIIQTVRGVGYSLRLVKNVAV
jgi:DNA-binding response OmpR family regulator